MGKVVSLYNGRDPRDLPMYNVGESAAFLGIPRSTLGTWIHGQRVRGRLKMERLLTADEETGLLTFNNLTEAYVLASLTRKFSLPMQRVRAALLSIGGARPLLTTVFRTDRRGIYVEKMGALVDASRGDQAAMREVVEDSLERVELDSKRLPSRLYPWRLAPDEPKVIALDPRRSFGKPTVVGTGVQMDVIVDRHQAGDSVKQLAADYGLTGEVVEDVLRWGHDVAKAA